MCHRFKIANSYHRASLRLHDEYTGPCRSHPFFEEGGGHGLF